MGHGNMKYNNLTDLVKGLGSTRPNEQFVSEISTGRILTYWEFYQMVQVRASYLRQCGVNVHDKVGLMYKRRTEVHFSRCKYKIYNS